MGRCIRAGAILACCLLLAAGAWAQYGNPAYEGYDYENAYDGGYDNYGDGVDGYGGKGAGGYNDYYDDDYGYYQDADKEYYDYYGYYADDDAGYGDDYYDEEDTSTNDCAIDPTTNKPVLPAGHVSCDIKVTMKQAGALARDIDGLYKLEACYNNKPMYRRASSPAGQDRVLWYSSTFGDWDVSKGREPDEMEVLMYGGEMEHVSAPVFVTNWHAQDVTDDDMDSFMASKADVVCADGSTPAKDPNPMGNKFSGLSPDEMEAKYMQIYSNMRRPDPSPEVNFTFVVLLVVLGLSIVLAIPYFLLQRRTGGAGRKGASEGSFISSFAEVLQRNRKVQGGHVN